MTEPDEHREPYEDVSEAMFEILSRRETLGPDDGLGFEPPFERPALRTEDFFQ